MTFLVSLYVCVMVSCSVQDPSKMDCIEYSTLNGLTACTISNFGGTNRPLFSSILEKTSIYHPSLDDMSQYYMTNNQHLYDISGSQIVQKYIFEVLSCLL